MTTDIKAAIAGAIEAFRCAEHEILCTLATSTDWTHEEINKYPALVMVRESLAALRRIEFVDARQMKLNNSESSYADGIRTGWNMFADHLTTTGHAIVKMEE